MSDENKVSYSVIAGELRKSARQYEVFKHASEAADILANFEREYKAMQKDREQLSKECLELDSKCDAAVEKYKEVMKAINDAENTKEEIISKARVEALNIIKDAKSKAEVEKNSIIDFIAGAQDQVTQIKEEIKQLENRKIDAIKEAQKAEAKVKEIKANIIKSFE